MKTLVTGGSGYLGTHVRNHFDADDMSRRAGLNILDSHDVQMVADYDLVIHLAALLDKSPDAAEEVFLTNVEGTVNVLKNMRKDACFIFASTKDVYGRFADNFSEVTEECPTLYSGQSALEWSKLIAERYVEFHAHQNGFRACIFRLSNVYAPASEGNTTGFVGSLVDAINRGESLRLPGAGRPVRDHLHVNDFAAACEAFADSTIRHGLYNLGGGTKNAVSLNMLVEMLERVSGLQAVVDEANPLPGPVPFNYVSSLQRVDQELGWRPRIDLDTGLKALF
jgi:nucleoside-diphosphate-sugar epimerase